MRRGKTWTTVLRFVNRVVKSLFLLDSLPTYKIAMYNNYTDRYHMKKGGLMYAGKTDDFTFIILCLFLILDCIFSLFFTGYTRNCIFFFLSFIFLFLQVC